MTVKCNLCGKSNFKTVEDDQLPYRVLQCNDCSLVFVHPHPDSAELKDHYDHVYYTEWIEAQKHKRFRMWEKRTRNVIIRAGKAGHLLDVGCGEGTFLAFAQKEGWEVSGTELSAFAAQYATKMLNTDIFCGDVLSAHFKENFFDVVTMWHVLEHVDDPKKYLREIYRILKPTGLLVLAVPNVNNLIFQFAYRILKGQKLKLFTMGEKEIHLYHFSPFTLKSYLKNTGFNCLNMSPDFGIIEPAKKMINWISVIPYYLGGVQIFNAIEAVASPNK